MSDHSRHLPDDGGQVPADIAGIARALDEVGAKERGRLSPRGLDRVFAASDLQLPLAGEARPVVGRVGPMSMTRSRGPSTVRFVLRAAGIAVAVCGALVAVYLVSRALRGDEGAVGSAPGGTLVQGAPASSDATEHVATPARPLEPRHVEAVLAEASAGPRETAILALADRSASGLDVESDDGDAFAGLLGASAFLDGAQPTYEDLSGEFAALVAGTGG
ncbi:MAG: hypothetical protein ACO3IB_05360 [Phycisphaerales bacterium]